MKRPLYLSRRRFLSGAAALPLSGLLSNAYAQPNTAKRVIFVYFPDGVPGSSQSGDSSLWHCSGSEFDFSMPTVIEPLVPWKDSCIFFRGLTSGATDDGSHPGAAKKLLTAVDHGGGESIDQFLGRTVGYSSPWRNLYLGVQANYNNASGDKHIVYPAANTTMSPQDNPAQAFQDLFGSYTPSSEPQTEPTSNRRAEILAALEEEALTLRQSLGGIEKDKLDYHISSIQELSARFETTDENISLSDSCSTPYLATDSIGDLYDPSSFPAICKAQMDLTLLAMECNMTKVATIQLSHHTSELIMSRFSGSEMYDPNYDMRSHQASHYGSNHNWDSREFTSFVQQRRWFVQQYAYLLEQLHARPEGSGTMLDNSIVVLCSEVADGNTHSHYDLPIIISGGGGGSIRGGRLFNMENRSHGDLWAGIAYTMGETISSFGSGSGIISLG